MLPLEPTAYPILNFIQYLSKKIHTNTFQKKETYKK